MAGAQVAGTTTYANGSRPVPLLWIERMNRRDGMPWVASLLFAASAGLDGEAGEGGSGGGAAPAGANKRQATYQPVSRASS